MWGVDIWIILLQQTFYYQCTTSKNTHAPPPAIAAHTYTCTHVYTHVHMYTHMYTHTHAHVYTCTHVRTCIQYTHACTHVCIHTYACTHACTHTPTTPYHAASAFYQKSKAPRHSLHPVTLSLGHSKEEGPPDWKNISSSNQETTLHRPSVGGAEGPTAR